MNFSVRRVIVAPRYHLSSPFLIVSYRNSLRYRSAVSAGAATIDDALIYSGNIAPILHPVTPSDSAAFDVTYGKWCEGGRGVTIISSDTADSSWMIVVADRLCENVRKSERKSERLIYFEEAFSTSACLI